MRYNEIHNCNEQCDIFRLVIGTLAPWQDITRSERDNFDGRYETIGRRNVGTTPSGIRFEVAVRRYTRTRGIGRRSVGIGPIRFARRRSCRVAYWPLNVP